MAVIFDAAGGFAKAHPADWATACDIFKSATKAHKKDGRKLLIFVRGRSGDALNSQEAKEQRSKEYKQNLRALCVLYVNNTSKDAWANGRDEAV